MRLRVATHRRRDVTTVGRCTQKWQSDRRGVRTVSVRNFRASAYYPVPGAHIRISPIASSRRIPGLRNVTALTVAPAAAALTVWLLVSLASPGAAPVYEASISLTFAGELDLPQPPPNAGAPETRVPAAADSIEFAGWLIAQPRFDFRTPFTTEISGDRRTITFFARDIVREDAVEFAL